MKKRERQARQKAADAVTYDLEWSRANASALWQWRPRLVHEFGLLEPLADRLRIVTMLVVTEPDGLVVRAGLGDGVLVVSVELAGDEVLIEALAATPRLSLGRFVTLRPLKRRESAARGLVESTPQAALRYYEPVAVFAPPHLRWAASRICRLMGQSPLGRRFEAAFLALIEGEQG